MIISVLAGLLYIYTIYIVCILFDSTRALKHGVTLQKKVHVMLDDKVFIALLTKYFWLKNSVKMLAGIKLLNPLL